MFKISQRVVQVHDGLRGRIVAADHSGFYVEFDNGDDVEAFRADDLMSERDWDRAGAEIRAEARAERTAFGYER